MRYFEKQSEESEEEARKKWNSLKSLNSSGDQRNLKFRRGVSSSGKNWIGHSALVGGGGIAGALTGRLINNDNPTSTIVGGAVTYAQPKAPAAITRGALNLYRKVFRK